MFARAMSCCAVVSLFVLPAQAQAQFLGPLEDLFRKIDGVTIFGTIGSLTSSEQITTNDFFGISAVRGMGVEVLIDLAEVDPDSGRWGLELAFGADYLTGFVAENPGMDLRGSIRGLPTLSAYATPPLDLRGWNPYLGLNVGFVQLWNVEVYDPEGKQFDLIGNTFQIGFALGLFHKSGIFLETSYRNRDFRSIRWSFPSGTSALPEGWPRSVDLSAMLFSLGFQFGALTRS